MKESTEQNYTHPIKIAIYLCDIMTHKDLNEYTTMEKNMALTITAAAYFLEHKQDRKTFLEFCSDMYEVSQEIYNQSNLNDAQ